MFAQGMESIIRDPPDSPSQTHDLEMTTLRRRPGKHASRGDPFNS